MLLTKNNMILIVDILRNKFEINEYIEEVIMDENNIMPTILYDFFCFMKKRGYILKKHKPNKDVKYRDLKDYNDRNTYKLSCYIDSFSKKKIHRYKSSIMDFDEGGRSIVELFLLERKIDDISKVKLLIYLNDYVLFFLKTTRIRLTFEKKHMKNNIIEEIKILKNKKLELFMNGLS